MDEQQLKAVANSFKNLRATTTQTAAAPAQKAAEEQKQEAAKPKRKSLADKIADLEAREEKLKQQKRKLQTEQNRKERSARTHRFCVIGAEIEKLAGSRMDSDEKKDAFLSWLRSHWGK